MNAIVPESFSKRSFVYRKQSGASFSEAADGALVVGFGNDRVQAQQCGLLDLSILPRIGFRGFNSAMHLEALGLPAPAQPNQARVSAGGELVLRLSQKEFWVLASLADQGAQVTSLHQRDLPNKDCYPLYCQDSHAWFALTGADLPELFAKICGVDLRQAAFPVGSIAQTSVARVNAIVINRPVNDIPCFFILSDSAAAEYLWECLLDAMNEFGGEPVGVSALAR